MSECNKYIYVTETMIDLNLDLNEEIDFDFFDTVETPSKEQQELVPLIKEQDTVSNALSGSCFPQYLGDDDDVQINPHLLCHDLRVSKVLSTTGANKDIHQSSNRIEEPLSTSTNNEEKYSNNFDEYDISKMTENTNIRTSQNMPVKKVSMPFSCTTHPSVMKESSEQSFSQSEKPFLYSKPNECRENDISFKSGCDGPLTSEFDADDKGGASSSRKSSLSHGSIKSNDSPNEDAFSKSGLSQDGVSTKSSENHKEDASSKSSKSQRAEGSGSSYDSDEGCPFEGSDNDELLLGVHTLTIISRENYESTPQRPKTSEQLDTISENQVIHSPSCEKAAITARSSSGYSSASCKAHGCLVSRGNTSKGAGRQSSQMKACTTPDMDEFIKSFRKAQPSPASLANFDKYSTSKNRKRRNMSFSNDELQRIERENAILLNKIVLQQRARPTVVHKYERRVTSNAINRAQQLKKIEYDNEILLRKIQDAKRKSTSAQNSRCISQASTSQF